jgi:hypothetical protein
MVRLSVVFMSSDTDCINDSMFDPTMRIPPIYDINRSYSGRDADLGYNLVYIGR